MAKKEFGFDLVPLKDARGKVVRVAARETEIPALTKDQKKSAQLIGWSAGPKNRRQKLMRNLFG